MKFCYHCMAQISDDKAMFCPMCGESLKPKEQKSRFLLAGNVLAGKYIVGDPLGAGGFGNTYLGWDKVLQRKVAIKEFYPQQYCGRSNNRKTVQITDEKMQMRFSYGLEKFLAEARNVAALHDVQGVVEISNFFEENGTGYIVMEYLEGMDVKNILKRSGEKKDYEWSRRVILTVLYTLKEVHKRGVLHRDISPDNIFVTKEGIVKLIDFGAARNYTEAEQSGEILLKNGYAPIEQYNNQFQQGPYTDLYAVAALFYRMLTGEKPVSALQRLEKDTLVSLEDRNVQIPDQAKMAIMMCLSMMPEQRLQTAEEFMEALDGKYYIPVYEPDWILPKEPPKGWRGKLAALPTGGKVAICLLGIALVGITAFGVGNLFTHKESTMLEENADAVMADLIGMTQEEAEDHVKQLNRRAGVDLSVVTTTVFDLSKENGTVLEQSIPAGTALQDEDFKQSDPQEHLELSLVLISNEAIRYEELKDLNAYEIAQKLGVDTSDSKHFVPKENDKDYYDLISIKVGSEVIKAKELQNNPEKSFAYDPDIVISYAASDFFYWESLPDFTQFEKVDAIPEMQTYRYLNETTMQPAGMERPVSLVDQKYVAFASDHEVGDVVAQTVEAGKEYNETRPDEKKLRIKAIGRIVDYRGKTADQFLKELAEKEIFYDKVIVSTSSGGSGNSGWQISDVKAYRVSEKTGEVTDEQRKYFKCEEDDHDVCFKIIVKEPVQAPAPAPSNGGSSNSGSSNVMRSSDYMSSGF